MVRVRSIVAALAVISALVGYLPLFPYLDLVARYFFPVALLCGIYADRNNIPHRGRILTAGSLLFFIYYGAQFSLNQVVPVTSNLLVSLLSIRMLGEKNGRNYLQIFGLSLFCLAASSLYNLSGSFMWYLMLLFLLLAVSLVLLTFLAHDQELLLDRKSLKRVLGAALLLPAASVPIMLVLFVILPRTQYPLWDAMNSGGVNSVGMSDRVRPGAAAAVSVQGTPAFRAVVDKLPDSSLYWRGIVMNGFSGDAWVRVDVPEELTLPGRGQRRVTQTIYPEPNRPPYLLALNVPLDMSGIRYTRAPDRIFFSGRIGANRVSYQAVSDASGVLRTPEGIDRDFYLQLPSHLPVRLTAKARDIARAATTEEKLAQLEDFFRAQKIGYATTGLPVGTEPLDQFLFVTRKGNCEYFASSAALMLRIAGVPARLVGGYRGGNYNETGRYYLVTEDMAHVWVEAFVEGKGWVSVEPSGWSMGFGKERRPVNHLRMYLDAAGFFWNKTVVNYNLEKQLDLVQTAGSRLRNVSAPQVFAKPVAVGMALAVLLFVAYHLLTVPRTSPAQKLLKSFLAAVARRYPSMDVHSIGIFELARRTRDPLLHDFVSVYGAAFYRDRPLGSDELARLKKIVAELRQQPPASA